MVRYMSTFRLKPDEDQEKAIKLWHEVHAPNVMKSKEFGIKKYVISRILSAPGGGDDFFGMVELYFDNLETAQKCMEFVASNGPDAFTEVITDSRRVFALEGELLYEQN